MKNGAGEEKILGMVPRQLFINGQWRAASSGQTFPVEDPATGEVLVEVADASSDDAMAALDAAVDAQPAWAATPHPVGGARSCAGRSTR